VLAGLTSPTVTPELTERNVLSSLGASLLVELSLVGEGEALAFFSGVA